MNKTYIAIIIGMFLIAGVIAGGILSKEIPMDEKLIDFADRDTLTKDKLSYSETEYSNGDIKVCVMLEVDIIGKLSKVPVGCEFTTDSNKINEIETRITNDYLSFRKSASETKTPSTTKTTEGGIVLK